MGCVPSSPAALPPLSAVGYWVSIEPEQQTSLSDKTTFLAARQRLLETTRKTELWLRADGLVQYYRPSAGGSAGQSSAADRRSAIGALSHYDRHAFRVLTACRLVTERFELDSDGPYVRNDRWFMRVDGELLYKLTDGNTLPADAFRGAPTMGPHWKQAACTLYGVRAC